MPEPDGYVTSRDLFLLVQDLDRKISSLCAQAKNLAERAKEDREAVDGLCEDLETLRDSLGDIKTRVNAVCGAAVIISGALAVWANFNTLFG